MRVIWGLLLVGWAGGAAAQSALEGAPGLYGSASDPATSCATNPHRLDVMAQPPHVMLTWTLPKEGPPGVRRLVERYDLEAADDRSLTLREEGDYRPDRVGGPFWTLRPTAHPPGYCWRRPEWPMMRCEDQQLRCESATS